MNATRIASLLEEASNHYNNGAYEQAIALWKQVLAADPSNQKAREGIQMANLLGAEWSEPERADSAAGDPQEQEKLAAGVQRIRDLIAAGQIDDAREGCSLLLSIAPGLPILKELAAEVERAGAGEILLDGGDVAEASEADLEAVLQEAREALAAGRHTDATRAASRALELDPGNIEACGVLSRAVDDGTITGPIAAMRKAAAEEAISLDDAPISLDDHDAPAAGAPTSERGKLAEIIRAGQEQYEGGLLQNAIETWSRVFALDSGNAQAGALIDKAKGELDEQGRRVDELFYKGVDAQEAGQYDQALGHFRMVLSISPLHPEAHERIQEIEARMAGGAEAIAIDRAAREEAEREKEAARKAAGAEVVFKEPESVPLARPEPVPLRARAKAAESSYDSMEADVPVNLNLRPRATGGGKGRLLAAAAGVMLVAGAGVGAWLYFGSDSGSMSEALANPPAPPVAAPRPAGKAPAEAPPAAAGTTLAVLPGATVAPKPPAEPPPPAPAAKLDPAQAAAVEREGLAFFREGRWAEAVLTLRKALEMNPVDFAARDQLDKAMVELEKQARFERESEQSTRMFATGEYGEALHKFYRLQQDHPELKQLDRWIVNAWYNWGVALLQAGSPNEAVEKFDEALAIAPGDREAAKAREVAKRYKGMKVDAALTAFASALPLRTLEDR